MNETANIPTPPPKKSSVRQIIGIISGVVVLIVIGLYFLGKSQQTATDSTALSSNNQIQPQQSGEEIRKNADKMFLLQATQNTNKPTAPSKQAQIVIDQAWDKFYKADYDGSIADFKSAYTIDAKSPNPNLPDFYLTLGIILGKKNDYDGSIIILSKGAEANPRHTRTICTLAYSYVNKYVDNPRQNS